MAWAHDDTEETNELPLVPLKDIPSAQKQIGGSDSSDSSPEAGVYTEGGLVFVPDSDTKGHLARKLIEEQFLNDINCKCFKQ